MQLEGGQARALQQRAGFVREDAEVHAALTAQMDGGQRRAVLGGGQLTGVAMGQDAVAVLDQAQAVLADLAAHPHVLILDGDALPVQQLLDLGDGLLPVVDDDLLHAVERPGEVDGGRAGGVEVLLGLLELGVEVVVVLGLDLLGRQVHAEAAGHADGGRAAHLEQIDGLPDVLLLGQAQHLDLVGQLGLIQNHQRALLIVQRDGFIAHDVLLLSHDGFLLYLAAASARRTASMKSLPVLKAVRFMM